MRVSNERLIELLATVTSVGRQRIPPGTPCFWDTKDRIACTYDELRSVMIELQQRRASESQ